MGPWIIDRTVMKQSEALGALCFLNDEPHLSYLCVCVCVYMPRINQIVFFSLSIWIDWTARRRPVRRPSRWHQPRIAAWSPIRRSFGMKRKIFFPPSLYLVIIEAVANSILFLKKFVFDNGLLIRNIFLVFAFLRQLVSNFICFYSIKKNHNKPVQRGVLIRQVERPVGPL